MRTHKKHGVLLCGVSGFKVYSAPTGFYRIVFGSDYVDIPRDQDSIVIKYVNLPYQPISDRQLITDQFLDLVRGLL